MGRARDIQPASWRNHAEYCQAEELGLLTCSLIFAKGAAMKLE